jgi:hypothetical protein
MVVADRCSVECRKELHIEQILRSSRQDGSMCSDPIESRLEVSVVESFEGLRLCGSGIGLVSG